MKCVLKTIREGDLVYQALAFTCPGCEAMGYHGFHLLPVNSKEKDGWDFDGNLNEPTLRPSIRTRYDDQFVCHSFLIKGQFEFCTDSTHPLAGTTTPMPDLDPMYIGEYDETAKME